MCAEPLAPWCDDPSGFSSRMLAPWPAPFEPGQYPLNLQTGLGFSRNHPHETGGPDSHVSIPKSQIINDNSGCNGSGRTVR